jgi:peptidoglycan hydrolase CwlO-like protein
MQGAKASFILSLALFGAFVAPTSAELVQTSPLSKVLDLLTSLTAKIVAEGEKEAKAYKEYFDWCDDFSKSKGFEIKTLTAKKEKLMAEIAQLGASIAASTDEIADLSAKIAADETELKDATLIREKEASEFATNEADLVETIDTLTRAISILEKEMAKNPAAFAQLSASTSIENVVSALGAIVDAAAFSAHDKQKLVALVQSSSDADDGDINAPAAAVYKTHSTSIFDLLEDLKEKAEGELADLRKAETNTKHNFEMLKQSLEDSIAADTKAKDEAAAAKAAAEEGKATAESDLAMTEKALDDAKTALAEANADCMQVAADHEATVTGRTEELTALAAAKKVLEETSSGAVTQAYGLLQVAEQSSSQLRSRSDLVNAEVVSLVKKLAREHHSASLAQLASRIAAVYKYSTSSGEDPFVKVKGLITDLIAKLTAEAEAAATEKAWCDEQMAKTEEKQTELEEDVAKLTTKIDKASAKSASLKDEVKVLQAELAALAKSQAEMDSIRAEEHSDFEVAKADLSLGLEGVRKALLVLRDYYGSAAALVQSSAAQPATPELFAKASGAGGGILDILEVVESDFASSLAKEEKEESDASTEYDKVTQENAVTKTLKLQDVKYKTQEFTGLDKAIADLSSDLATEQKELAAVNEYYGKVKDRCIAVPETYEERKARREAEIAGLKEALNVLETETAFMQRGRKGGRRSHFLAASL